MKNKQLTILGLSAFLFLGVSASFAQETVYFDDDFESYSVGQQPTRPGDGNDNFWSFNVPPDGEENREINVVATEDAQGTATQALRVRQEMPLENSRQGISLRRKFGPVSSGEVEVRFQFRLNENLHDPEISTSAGTYQQINILDDNLDRAFVLQVTLDGEDGLRDRRSPDDPKPGFTIHQGPDDEDRLNLVPQILEEDWYEIVVNLDMDNQSLDIAVTNLNSDDPEQSGSASGLPFRDDISHISEFWSGRAWTWCVLDAHVNDFVIRTAPEVDLEGFAAWRNEHFGAPDTPEGAAESDPDGDGVDNLLEYALGGNPLEPSREPLPVVAVEEDRLTLSFNRPPERSDIGYIVEASPDLSEWTGIAELPAGATEWTGEAEVEEGEEDPSGRIPTQVRSVEPPAERGFLRLRVEQP